MDALPTFAAHSSGTAWDANREALKVVERAAAEVASAALAPLLEAAQQELEAATAQRDETVRKARRR